MKVILTLKAGLVMPLTDMTTPDRSEQFGFLTPLKEYIINYKIIITK